ncbi:MAG: class I mannose-6-phosphate isomerase [Verrucomicrobiaceae bacterium]|nr:class I mannose-6-phosphate isomerase [Verrucomicrobiaceae bacterium]
MGPILFKPIYQGRIWGGRRLASVLGRELPGRYEPIGESWEVSDREEAMSLVRGDGATSLHELWMTRRAEVFGEALVGHPSPRFPLLMKILDACDDLSIQVHPPVGVAAELGGEPKTEMWFVAHADPGAKIYAGLREGVKRVDFEEALRTGKVADVVHALLPKSGDCLFIPSGRIHAIGAGLLIYEIQQNSDTTYRVFDWNRTDANGKPRQLHIEQSLRSIDFTDFEPRMARPTADGTVAKCEFFDVRESTLSPGGAAGESGESLTIAVTRGTLRCGDVALSAGDFCLIPACLATENRRIDGCSADSHWLEIRIP